MLPVDEPGLARCPLARRQQHDIANAAADNERLFLMSFVRLLVKTLFA